MKKAYLIFLIELMLSIILPGNLTVVWRAFSYFQYWKENYL